MVSVEAGEAGPAPTELCVRFVHVDSPMKAGLNLQIFLFYSRDMRMKRIDDLFVLWLQSTTTKCIRHVDISWTYLMIFCFSVDTAMMKWCKMLFHVYIILQYIKKNRMYENDEIRASHRKMTTVFSLTLYEQKPGITFSMPPFS